MIIEEMRKVREYCSLIHKARRDSGFVSVRYPLISVSLDRYFLPEFRQLIADECNLIGYMDIPPVETDVSQTTPVVLDTTTTTWQDEMYRERTEKRKQAQLRKENDTDNNSNKKAAQTTS